PCDVVAFGIVLEMLNAENLAEARPALVIHADHRNITVLGGESADDAMKERMATARALGLLAGQRGVVELERLPGDHRAVDRYVNALPLARAFAVEQGRQDARGQRQAAGLVGDRRGGGSGRLAGHPLFGHDSARGLGQGIAARAHRPRTDRTPGARLRENDARVDLSQILEAETQTIEHAWSVVGQENVITPRHPADDLGALGLFEVRSDTALAPIHREEIVGHVGILDLAAADQASQQPATKVAGLAILDFGDLGPEIGQKESGKRPLDLLADLDNLDALKRLAHLRLCSAKEVSRA